VRDLQFTGSGHEHKGKRGDFDPIAAGKEYGLDPEVSSAIWTRVCEQSRGRDGYLDEALARQRFEELAKWVAAHGGVLRPVPGRTTRHQVEASGVERWRDMRAAHVPGRTTLQEVEEQRDRLRRGTTATAQADHDEPANHRGVLDLLAWLSSPSVDLTGAAGADGTRGNSESERLAARAATDPASRPTQRADPLVALPRSSAARATPLDPTAGSRMSRLFGVDLTRVQVVPNSPLATGSIKAVTRDGEVHFRAGAYHPGTAEGDRLIAHELAHVVQQQGRGTRAGSRDELEREADRAAALTSRGRAARISFRGEPAVAYAFNEGEHHDDGLEDGVDDTNGSDARADETAHAAHVPEPHAQSQAESQIGEDETGHDGLEAATAAVTAVIPGEETAGGARGGGGGAPAKPVKDGPRATAAPEVALGQLRGVRPDRMTLLFGQMHTANTADIAKARAAQRANPPKQMSTGASAAPTAGKAAGAAPGPASNPKTTGAPRVANDDADHAVKAEVPGAEAAKHARQRDVAAQREAVTQVVAATKRSIESWFGSWSGKSENPREAANAAKMSESEARQLVGAVDNIPTTATDVSTDTGPAPELAMKSEAKASADKDRIELDKTAAALETLGQAESRAPMGEDHLESTVASEELTAAPPPVAPGGPAAALPSVAAAATSEEVGIVAQEQHGAEIDAALTQASTDITAKRSEEAQAEARTRAGVEAQIREAKTKADADGDAARIAAQADVQQARGQWQAEMSQKGAEARKQADKRVAEGMSQVEAEEAKANAEAKHHIDEGKRKADEEKQKGEKEAADAKSKGKSKSSGFWGWVSSKAKAVANGIKHAVTAAIDACRRAIKAVIAAAKKLAMAVIALARKVIVGLIKAVGKALIAISDVLLAGFPALKAKFQSAIRKSIDKAVSVVNKLADGLKKALQKALDWLGNALDKGLQLLEKGINAVIDAASAVVQGAIKAAQAVVEALGTWAKLIKDVATGPGSWISKLGAAVVDGIKNHLWSAFRTTVMEWFKSKVFELLGVGGIILQVLLEGGMSKEDIIQMALDALIVAIPAALVAILIEKLVSMIVPAAGAVMAIIEGLQAAWGTISRIIAAFAAFMAFLLAIKNGGAGPLFATVLAGAAVVVLDFVANWLLKKLASAARKVGAKLKGLAAKFKRKGKGKHDPKRPKPHHDEHHAKSPKEHDDHDGESHKNADKSDGKAGDQSTGKKEEDKQRRLADAVRLIRPKLAALIAKRPSKLRVRGQLVVWKLRHRLTELRMEPHGKQVEFIAKVNPQETVGNAEDLPLGQELQHAESPRTGFYYRGDDEWRPGDSVGVPLTDDTPLPDAQEVIDHVHPKAKDEKKRSARGRDDDAGPVKTFVSFAEIIGTRAGGAAKFTRMNRISKVAREAVDRLVAEGKLRILTPDDVAELIKANDKPRIRREANNVKDTMLRNHEVLIQGLVPGDLLGPVK
jgi:Domain of unknown function (DUF4157)